MTLKELTVQSRTRRRFDHSVKVTQEQFRELVGLARLCPSTANSQALKFMFVNDEETCAKVYENLVWAGALPDWPGPTEEERPSAYILILCDLALAKEKPMDDGICAQTMMLGAAEMGLGGCIFGSVKRDALATALGLDSARWHIDLVLGLGKPVEKVVVVDVPETGDTKYYRDAQGTHYVPKRSVDELIVRA